MYFEKYQPSRTATFFLEQGVEVAYPGYFFEYVANVTKVLASML